ncbi:GldM family protein [Winogradskyella forsetii]|uniref:GldM family protein n=1 Tax=Winogradskyella forsetii TaxID=2686077 RepID=UPI0015BA8467|nr:GldM family protein [Winogradskyella forsetii]
MKKANIYPILILVLALNCKSSQSKTQLVSENKALKERIEKLQSLDSLKTEATLELKKMNVVYRGVSNPIYISKPNVIWFEASAPGLKEKDKKGNYILAPGSGNTIDITIKSKLNNGDSLTEIKTLRIKDIKAPIGTINKLGCGANCELKFKKKELTNAVIDAKIYDFLHEMDFVVNSFKIKMPHYRTLEIDGNTMNIWANDLFTLLRPGDLIQIFDINIHISGSSSYRLKGVSPILIKIIE